MSGSVDFVKQLDKQLLFIEASSREYDAGSVDEGVRIATALRVIFHNTANSTSLLVHMAASNTRILSTAGKRVRSDPNGFWPALVQIQWNLETNELACNPTFNCRPRAHRKIAAPAWWDGELVFYSSGKQYKRKKLALHAANKDGGAHVDASLPDDYNWLINGADFATNIVKADGREFPKKLPHPHLAYLRQMAHEVLKQPRPLQARWPVGNRRLKLGVTLHNS